MNAIEKVYNETDYEEYLILNESMIVKDNTIFDICFQEHKGTQVELGQGFLMFLGKFLREYMSPFPEVKTKRDDVLLGENVWCERMNQHPKVSIQPLFDTYSKYEEKNGRNNMILENDYFIKYKGTWNLGMIT